MSQYQITDSPFLSPYISYKSSEEKVLYYRSFGPSEKLLLYIQKLNGKNDFGTIKYRLRSSDAFVSFYEDSGKKKDSGLYCEKDNVGLSFISL